MSRLPVKFYFDAISPYAWLAWRPLKEITARHGIVLDPVPVLFAGLLKANGQLGPAEIPNKRLWLIKDVMRRADSQGMKVLAPPTHPFNPLLALRVASIDMEVDMKHNLVQELLDAAWRHGKDISNDSVVADICTSVGLNGKLCVQRAREEADVKDRLKTQTESAVAAGVFGVPTTSVNGELFWGSEIDTMNHIESAILGRDPLDLEVYERWKHITPSAVRKR
jgi:2-hydroxychromene-2-carboxylate isomerase